jgi:hypothetical protein
MDRIVLQVAREYREFLPDLQTFLAEEKRRGRILDYGTTPPSVRKRAPSLEEIFFITASVKYAFDIYKHIRSWYAECKTKEPALSPPILRYKKTSITFEGGFRHFRAVLEETEIKRTGRRRS